MKTKYNIGDSVLIKGTVRRIEITKEGVINYEVTVETDDDVLGQYGFNRVTEDDLENWRKLWFSGFESTKKEESKNDSMY